MAGNLTLQDIMICLWAIFKKYAGKDGNDATLSQDELCDMARKEFPLLMESDKKEDILKGIVGQMDLDGNNSVTYPEFITFFGALSMALGSELDKMKPGH